MKNIKRILCLTLSAIMLCATMAFNTGAAFKDEAQIIHKEAAAITEGLGLFAGTTDGNFDPTGTVTRAQMAAVVAKMLYGADLNANQFKGAAKFSDTVAFEGGWAEGYINLCTNLGIVAGYGDGTFRPGQAVTTAEAVTMIINALKVDAGEGTWPLTVMATAEGMKLFADVQIKPGTNVALTRDQLAPIVLAAIKYSPKGTTGYTIPGIPFVFDNFSDALTAVASSTMYDFTDIVEVVGEDTLAKTVFDMVSVTGFITDNQATGFEYTEVEGVALNLETGLDMIGHYVTAYYASEYEDNDPGIAYCVVDEAKYVIIAEDITNSKKEYQATFGTKKVAVADDVVLIDGIYAFDEDTKEIENYNADTWTAPCGTYVIYEGEIIAFIEGATKTLSKVNRVITNAGKEAIYVNGIGQKLANNEDEDIVNAYDGIAKDDIIVVTEANGIYTLTKAETIVGKITRTSKVNDVDTITVNGKQYAKFEATNKTGLVNTVGENFAWDETYVIYVADGKYIGWEGAGVTANISDIIYIIDTYEVNGVADTYGNVTANTYAQGIDMNGKEVSYLIAVDEIGDAEISAGFYTFKLSTDRDEKKAGIYTPSAVISNDYIVTGEADDTEENADIDSKSAFIDVNDDIAFIENHTKFIVVDETTAKQELDVAIRTGIYSVGDITGCPVILSKDGDNLTLEVVIIYDEVVFNADDYIYITEDSASYVVTVANGSLYNAYFVNDSIKRDIVTKQTDLTAGLYEYAIEVIDGVAIYELAVANTDLLLEDETFNRLSGTKLISDNIKAFEAGAAKVIDDRTADTIKNSEVAEVIELDDLAAAKDAGFIAIFDALLNEDNEVVLIIVTDFDEIELG